MSDAQYGPGSPPGDHLSGRTKALVRQATERKAPDALDSPDVAFRKASESRLIGLRVNRFSWWVHWRELADYILPRRYKWLITPNQMSRGSPINQHILDSTGSMAARNLAAGMMMGCSDPTKRWFKYKINRVDSTQTSPISLWLAEVERLIRLILAESNFYDSLAIFYFDLVVFGTAVMLIYEDYDHVIRCYNPCLGEYYVDNDGQYRPLIFAREFTNTISQVADTFGVENLSPSSARLWANGGTSLTRELVVAHMVEPNVDGRKFGIPDHFKFRECYWEWGGSASPQGGSSYSPGLLRKRGFYECPAVITRWDLVSNDPYGRSPGMDALPDIKQLQLETKRLSQGIDKMVNPPMIADVQLKNQPASLLPGGVTYVSGLMAQGRPGFAPAYLVNPQVNEMMQQIAAVQGRINETFYMNLFRVISQFETRSNVTATEVDARRAEAMLMLGPVLERLNHEGFATMHERIFGIASRAGVFPPAPPEVQGQHINIEFTSMIELAQNANQASGIERLLGVLGNLVGVDPAVMDNVDVDYALDKVSFLYNNDPKLIRSPQALAAIRTQRQQQQEQAAMAQKADTAQKLATGAKTLSETNVGPGGGNILQRITGQGA
jgi:Bacteriophage head to tail connecting protein